MLAPQNIAKKKTDMPSKNSVNNINIKENESSLMNQGDGVSGPLFFFIAFFHDGTFGML